MLAEVLVLDAEEEVGVTVPPMPTHIARYELAVRLVKRLASQSEPSQVFQLFRLAMVTPYSSAASLHP